MKGKQYFLILSFICFLTAMSAQNAQLARQYYSTGEYEKAGEIYQALYKKSKNATYFSYFVKCLIALEDFDNAEKIILKEIKRKSSPNLYVTYGDLFEMQSKTEEANEQYQKAINSVPNKSHLISQLANAFLRSTKYDLAIQTYEKGAQLLKDENIFAYNLGDLYRRKGDVKNMVKSYLLSIEKTPARLNSVQNIFARDLDSEGFALMKDQLLAKIQDNPDLVEFPELLQWLYTQQREYKKALRQATALDLRLNEDGTRVYNLASIAANAREYDVAISGLQYILDTKPNSTLALRSKEAIMTNKRKKITQNFDYTMEDLRSLEKEYEDFLSEEGKNANTALIMANLAELEAIYLNDLDKSISILNELIEIIGINKYILNNAKLDLGDYYLMQGEVWESTLLYSQVDKDLKEAFLGELARFKNAKLSYYNGDFEWAQSQFDILKASTSKMISNDAIDLSVFITDNLGLDTIATPMEMYARAELLRFQNRYTEAFSTLDSITTIFPEHGLTDDILYSKAQSYAKLKKYDLAVETYERIISEFSEEIRADNAIYELALLNEYQLDNIEKAKELYEKLFLEYSNSTFAIEARKKFRKLRGDEI